MKKDISIPSHIKYLNEVEYFVYTFLNDEGITDSLLGYICLTICESVNNAITHGNKLDIKKFVDIRIECQKKVLYIEVEDEGVGFEMDDVPDPTETENIKNESGRGIFIIKNLADHVEFLNNGSLVKIKFELNREHQLLL